MNGKRILLVENDEDDVELAVRALRKGNVSHEVIVARDGAEALDYVFGTGAYLGRDQRLLPALIILDLKLAKIDGLEVLRRLRANARTQLIPTVILTASREPQDVYMAYRLGANSYVCKPMNPNYFSDAVQQIGQYWLVLNEALPLEL